MRLDATDVRYITPEEFRVLTAVEMGSKNHEIVPTTLIAQISALRHAGISKLLSSLAKRKLVARVQNNAYDGFRLTYGGYDYLAVRALSKRKSIYSVGQRIGVGKESDIQIVANEEGQARVLKLHRLGRISFRKVKEKRDYMGTRKSASWMYMSRLAAEKEYEFMTVLHQHDFPVPTPIDQARHTVVMDFIDAYPLRQISGMPIDQVGKLYTSLMAMIVRLAKVGLIHGDFNEFNLLIREIDEDHGDEQNASHHEEEIGSRGSGREAPGITIDQGKGFERVVLPNELGSSSEEDSNSSNDRDEVSDDDMILFEDGVQLEPILIDFPQMVSIQHPDAEYYFDRDVDCVKRFFLRRFRFQSDEYPTFRETIESINGNETRLDILTKASGYNNQFNELSHQLQALRVTSESGSDEQTSDADSEDSQKWSESDTDSEGQEKESGEAGEMKDGTRPTGSIPGRRTLDSSTVATKVAVSQAQSARHAQKHHGRKAQATKAGRRHGGGKGKHNPKRTVADSLTF